jgi:hypothetical protein
VTIATSPEPETIPDQDEPTEQGLDEVTTSDQKLSLAERGRMGVKARQAAAAERKAAGEGIASAADRAIVSKLEAAAKRGDVAAARELREWRRLDASKGAGQDNLRLALLVSQLTTANRRELLDWLVERLREQESPAHGEVREGSDRGEEALPSARAEREAEGHPREPRDSDSASVPEVEAASH